MPENKISATEKLAIVQEIESSRIGLKSAVSKFKLSKNTLVKWRHLYRLYGVLS
ncbi:hypothetical protein AB4Z50_35185 [Paenibacillus sp. 2TAB26]|uniref:hypothetical protein n=1 Tax=Paenibacillus sp. 2TAB26 TaxID=3233005 RepID=UPI003F9E7266